MQQLSNRNMFKRYALYSNTDILIKNFGVVTSDSISGIPNYNAGAGNSMPIIISGLNRERLLLNATWDANTFDLSSNKSSLTSTDIKTSPVLQKAFKRKRCVIPINGYYDWKKITDTIKIPFYFRILNQDVFGVAGIFNILENGSYTFVPIETKANEIVEPLSETMPAILSNKLLDKWLDPLSPNPEILYDFLVPYTTIDMSSYRVNLKDTDNTSNSRELIQPVV